MPNETKVYLGDSVYAEFDGYSIILTTENGLPEDPSNIIVLEPEVLDSLIKYSANQYGQKELEKEESIDDKYSHGGYEDKSEENA